LRKSEYDRVLYELNVLEKKIQALQKLRERINNLAFEFRDDVYALELLLALDKTMFHWLNAMMSGREKLRQRLAAIGGGRA
jgi:prefoldin subunit 5